MATTSPRTGYAPVNGLELYYEIHGDGQPLVMVHGGFGTADTLFPQLVSSLAVSRQVILVELQGHGHTADIARPFTFEQMADDIAALIRHLGLQHADLCGLSLGGAVAWQTAIRHPGALRKLVIISAPGKRLGWYPETLVGMESITVEFMTDTPIHAAYLRTAPKPEDWPALVEKTRTLLTNDHYDWSAKIARITAPVLLVAGDADGVRLEHVVELFGLLGGGKVDGFARGRPPSQLAILPNTHHIDMMSRDHLLEAIIPPFLDAPLPEVK